MSDEMIDENVMLLTPDFGVGKVFIKIIALPPKRDFPILGKPAQVEPMLENPAQLNTK